MRSVIYFTGFLNFNPSIKQIYSKFNFTDQHTYLLANIFTSASPTYIMQDVVDAYNKTKNSKEIVIHSFGVGYFKLLLLNSILPNNVKKTIIIEGPIESNPTAWQQNIQKATNIQFTEELLHKMNMVLENETDEYWLKKVELLRPTKSMIIHRYPNPYVSLEYTNKIAQISNIKRMIILEETDPIKQIRYSNSINKFMYRDYYNFN